jgi:branched-chain amino acid transport system ATP-binding protein
VSALLLDVAGVDGGYGENQVLSGVDLRIALGSSHALLGRNGMGKTTLVRAILGLNPPTRGEIRFLGKRIDGLSTDEIASLGIAVVPEGRQIFPNLSVRENLIAFAADRSGNGRWTLPRVLELFPRLQARLVNMGNELSGGEQQMLAIARALMTNPRLLILDEATEGLAPLVRAEIWHCLALLRGKGLSILVIDKYIERLLPLVEQHTILERGRVAWQGDSSALANDRGLWHRYLGI